jgi:hypothetical protein
MKTGVAHAFLSLLSNEQIYKKANDLPLTQASSL